MQFEKWIKRDMFICENIEDKERYIEKFRKNIQNNKKVLTWQHEYCIIIKHVFGDEVRCGYTE